MSDNEEYEDSVLGELINGNHSVLIMIVPDSAMNEDEDGFPTLDLHPTMSSDRIVVAVAQSFVDTLTMNNSREQAISVIMGEVARCAETYFSKIGNN